ncbi:F-box protein PP2-A11-like isoform X3 [Castanea sativa]
MTLNFSQCRETNFIEAKVQHLGILQEELLHQIKRFLSSLPDDTLVFCKKSYWIKLIGGHESNARVWLHKRTGGVCLSIASKGLAITGIGD